MVTTQVSTLSPVYTFTIRQRAGLQILSHSMQYLAGGQRDEADLIARLDAAHLGWIAREKILRAAARRRMPHLRLLYREAIQIVWRNPQAGVR